jgi:predicted nicotinamide N-methyase
MTDYMQAPLQWAAMNWRLNHERAPDTALLDWRTPPAVMQADVVLASDVAYERRMFTPLLDALDRLVAREGVAVVTEPGRAMAKEFIRELSRSGFHYESEERKLNRKGIEHTVGIHVLKRSV